MIAGIVFWVALLILVYTYLGYPLVLHVRTRWRTRPVAKDLAYTPGVSLLIVVYNEEKGIRRKLENLLNLRYPAERIQIIVASDGSTDRTNDIVQEFQNRRVSLLSFAVRRGKTEVLNEVIPSCLGEIVVLADTRQMYNPLAVRELVANFCDPQVGAVTGNLQLQPLRDGKDGEQIGLYWKYEKWIRRLQSDADSTPVVTGAIYAIRKALFRPLPLKCIADDLAMPMSIIMQNYRVIFDPAAEAYDNFLPGTLNEDFQRRVRTIAGSYQYLTVMPAALNPRANRLFFDFLSHKVCRLVAPFAILAIFLANLAMAAEFYRVILILQVVFYMMALLGAGLASRGSVPRLLSAPYTFLMMNAAATVALFKLVAGTQTHLWEKPRV